MCNQRTKGAAVAGLREIALNITLFNVVTSQYSLALALHRVALKIL